VIRKIAKSDDNSASSWIGYTAGGAVGTYFGILISKRLHW
jgi:hypothetical protein